MSCWPSCRCRPGCSSPTPGVKTAVLVFRRPATATREGEPATKHVWFYEVRNDGYDPDKTPGRAGRRRRRRTTSQTCWRNGKAYKAGSFAAPPGLEANTLLPHGSVEPNAWWAIARAARSV